MNIFVETNHYISELLNNFVLNNNLQNCVKFFSDSPIFFLPIFLLATWIYFSLKEKNIEKKKDLLILFYGIVLGVIINLIIQQIVHIQRPESIITPILSHIPDASFPSDHSTVSFAFLAGLFLAGYKKVGYIFLPFVIIMNISRIAGGIHWFFDIIIGMIIGICSEIIIFKLKNNKNIENLNKFVLKLTSYIKL